MREIFETWRDQFQAIFGRPPRGTDKVDPHSYVDSVARITSGIEDAMDAAGTSKAYQHAFRKTGLIVTTQNQKLLSKVDLEEWKAAFDEYHTLRSQPEDPEQLAFSEAFKNLLAEYLRYPYLLGKVLTDCGKGSREVRRNDILLSQHSTVFFGAAKAFKAYRSTRLLAEQDLFEDCLAIARSIYDTYLYMVWTLMAPDTASEVILARMRIAGGTHEYKLSARGALDRRTAVPKGGGREIGIGVSSRQMASLSPFAVDLELWAELYEHLSRYVHPDMLTFPDYVDDNGYDTVNRHTWRSVVRCQRLAPCCL